MERKPTEEIAWAKGVPPKKKIKVPIVRPKTAQTLRFIVLDEEVTQAWTHWLGGRTQPCLGIGCECRQWPQGQNQRWKGYLMCIQKEGIPLCLAEITTEAWRDCPELQDETRSLRGALLTLKRQGSQPNGKVVASVQYNHSAAVKASPIDCKDALWDVWFAEGEQRLTQARIQGLGVRYQEKIKESAEQEGNDTVPLPKTEGVDRKESV